MAKKDIKRNPAAEKIADLILSNYDPKSWIISTQNFMPR